MLEIRSGIEIMVQRKAILMTVKPILMTVKWKMLIVFSFNITLFL